MAQVDILFLIRPSSSNAISVELERVSVLSA